MPNKTLFVRKDDLVLWERAERTANERRTTVSALVANALADYLGETEVITVPVYDAGGDERKERFAGRWLNDPALDSDKDTTHLGTPDPRFGHSGAPQEWRVGIAETARGQIAVYLHHWNYDYDKQTELHVFRSLDDARKELSDDPRVPRDIFAYAADRLSSGGRVVWRDI